MTSLTSLTSSTSSKKINPASELTGLRNFDVLQLKGIIFNLRRYNYNHISFYLENDLINKVEDRHLERIKMYEKNSIITTDLANRLRKHSANRRDGYYAILDAARKSRSTTQVGGREGQKE